MEEGRTDCHCSAGDSVALVSFPSFLEEVCKKNLEVIYMVDPIVNKFYEHFGNYLKLGVRVDPTSRTKVAVRVRYQTSISGDERGGFKEYADPMKVGQNDIYITSS